MKWIVEWEYYDHGVTSYVMLNTVLTDDYDTPAAAAHAVLKGMSHTQQAGFRRIVSVKSVWEVL
jgi:hypothetical protein